MSSPIRDHHGNLTHPSKGGLKFHYARKYINEECSFMLEQAANYDANVEHSIYSSKNHIRGLPRIPEAARLLAAMKLSEASKNCVSKNYEESWQHLLLFA